MIRRDALTKQISFNGFDILAHLLYYKKGKILGGYDSYAEAKEDGWSLPCLDAIEGGLMIHMRKDERLSKLLSNKASQEGLQELLGVYMIGTSKKKKKTSVPNPQYP